MTRRALSTLCLATACLAISASCTTNDDDDAPGSTTATTAATTTTAAPPLIRGLGETLGLDPGQCYDAVPTTTTTEAPPTTPATDESGETVTSEPPTTTTTIATTTIATSPLVAVVDCGGTFAGAAFATLCIGSLLEPDEPILRPSHLGEVACPGIAEMEWPGDRNLRRAAARVCLERFEERFGESYAESEIDTTEFVPSQGVWERGIRQVVCAASALAP